MCVAIKTWNIVGNIHLFDIPLWYLCTRAKFFNRTKHSNKYYNEISILFYNYQFFLCRNTFLRERFEEEGESWFAFFGLIN